MADLDRVFISQYSTEDIGITILVGSTPTDPDGDVAPTLTILNEDTQAILLTRLSTRVSEGNYQITLTPDDTAVLGNYTAIWEYILGSSHKTFESFFAIGGAEPAYDALTDGLKGLVDSVWIRMADMFDSPSGGPNLQTWASTNFNRGRVAQLMKIAVGRLNTMAQPISNYSIDGSTGVFPIVQWGPLLEQMTWIEVIKHLRRSYLEIPSFEGASISRLNRQVYYDRWGEMLHDEEANVEAQLSNFKISQMFLGRPSILVAGGAFGRYSSVNRPFMAARPRLWSLSVW